MSKKKTRRGRENTKRYKMKTSSRYKDQRLKEYWLNTSLERIARWDTELKIFKKETNKEREERLLARKGEIKNMTGLETSLTAKEANELNMDAPVTITKDPISQPINADEAASAFATGIKEEDSTLTSLIRPLDTVSGETSVHWKDRIDKYGYHRNIVDSIRTRLTTSNTGWFQDHEKTFLLTQIEFSEMLLPKTSQVAVIRNVLARWKLYNNKMTNNTIERKLDKNVRYWQREGSKSRVTAPERYYRQVTRQKSSEERKALKSDYALLRRYRFSVEEAAQIMNMLHGTDYASKTVRSWANDGTPPSSMETSEDAATEESPKAHSDVPDRTKEPIERPRPTVEVQKQAPGANTLIVKLIATIDKQDTAMSNLAKAIIKLTSQLNDQDRRIEELESLATEPRDKDTSLNLGDLNEQDAQVIKRFMEGAT